MNKLLAMAFDPDADDAEAAAAFRAARRLAHSTGQTWCSIVANAPSSPFILSPPPRRPATAPMMPFGRHKGRLLSELAEENPKYLQWLLDLPDLKSPLRRAISEALRMSPYS
ncbi:MAG: hypothetical protein ACKV19_14225 [Verrucomicrobiales bacterium]